jgi:hypothetical protein
MKPAVWKNPDDLFEFSHYMRVLDDIEMKSSPGLPLLYHAPTNGQLLKNADGSWNESRVHYLWALVQRALKNRTCDPIRIFVKNEPHKLQKIEEGRFRLIYAVSLVDQVIDKMLFSVMNDRMVELYGYIFPMGGWSQLTGGWRLMSHTEQGYDATAWEYTMPAWVCDAVLRIRTELCLNPNAETGHGTWLELANWRYSCLFDKPLFQLSSGLQIQQGVEGIMKSGCNNTLSDNSIGGGAVDDRCAVKVGERFDKSLKQLGDDGSRAKRMSEAKARAFRDYGILLKEPEQGEFCGMKFLPDNVIEPAYRGKHLTALKYLDPANAKETFQSYQILYGKSAYLPRIREIAMAICPDSFISDGRISEIYDGVF